MVLCANCNDDIPTVYGPPRYSMVHLVKWINMRLSFFVYMQFWKSIMILSGFHIHTLQKQLCLYYNSLGVSIHFHLAKPRVLDDTIYACILWLYVFHGIIMYELLNKHTSTEVHILKWYSVETACRGVYVKLVSHIETCMSLKLSLCILIW